MWKCERKTLKILDLLNGMIDGMEFDDVKESSLYSYMKFKENISTMELKRLSGNKRLEDALCILSRDIYDIIHY